MIICISPLLQRPPPHFCVLLRTLLYLLRPIASWFGLALCFCVLVRALACQRVRAPGSRAKKNPVLTGLRKKGKPCGLPCICFFGEKLIYENRHVRTLTSASRNVNRWGTCTPWRNYCVRPCSFGSGRSIAPSSISACALRPNQP